MAVKKKTTTKKSAQPKNTVEVQCHVGESVDDAIAQSLLYPEVQSASTILIWEQEGDVNALVKELSVQVKSVNDGNMQRAEAMLITQAHTLNELFNNLARRAQRQEYLKSFESYMRLALKSQSQCRSTLETLAAIKNPPVIFAKQANISNGHQQINNGAPSPATHAEEIKNSSNKLLEAQHGSETLDTRGTSATIGKDKALAALE